MLKPELLRRICVSSPICVTQSLSLRWSPLIWVTLAECKSEKFSILLIVETVSTHGKSIFCHISTAENQMKIGKMLTNAAVQKECGNLVTLPNLKKMLRAWKACDSWGLSKNHILWESCAFLDLMQRLWRQNSMYKPEFAVFFYTAQACNGSNKN